MITSVDEFLADRVDELFIPTEEHLFVFQEVEIIPMSEPYCVCYLLSDLLTIDELRSLLHMKL